MLLKPREDGEAFCFSIGHRTLASVGQAPMGKNLNISRESRRGVERSAVEDSAIIASSPFLESSDSSLESGKRWKQRNLHPIISNGI